MSPMQKLVSVVAVGGGIAAFAKKKAK